MMRPEPVLIPPARRDAIRRRLLSWYDAGHRELPWRSSQWDADPYRVWIAEVMLQQTQVATAIPYYRRFLQRYPTLEALASARDDDVMALWSGLGYYGRCRSLLAAAREALLRHAGLPASLEALADLPGFGPYTAGAVASIAFALPAAAVDGNSARVLARVFHVEGDLAERSVRDRVWRIASALVPGAEGTPPRSPPRPGDFNQALMELGATLCRKPVPQCRRCPLAALCAARRAGRERALPPPRRRNARMRLRIACAVVASGGNLLLARRAGTGLFAGLWELPSAPVPTEGSVAAALRSVLGRGLRVGPEIACVARTLTHRELSLSAYRCRLDGHPRAPGAAELRWCRPGRLRDLPVSSAMRALIAAL